MVSVETMEQLELKLDTQDLQRTSPEMDLDPNSIPVSCLPALSTRATSLQSNTTETTQIDTDAEMQNASGDGSSNPTEEPKSPTGTHSPTNTTPLPDSAERNLTIEDEPDTDVEDEEGNLVVPGVNDSTTTQMDTEKKGDKKKRHESDSEPDGEARGEFGRDENKRRKKLFDTW